MDRRDLMELRKVIKAKDTVIDWIYSIYVDPDNQIAYEGITRLLDLEDSERFRHLAIFAKILGTRIGISTFPEALKAQQESLLDLRSASGTDLYEFEAFRDHLLESYSHTDPYYATLVRVIYDVPAKAGDGRRLEDGDRVYEALLLAICPAKLSKATLGYDVDHVGELDRRWQIGNPSCGFLYPAFSDRGEDRSEVLIYSANPNTEEYLNGLFGIEEEASPVSARAQMNLFGEVLGKLDVSLEAAAEITGAIVDKAADEEGTDLIREDVRKIIEDAGVDTGSFDEVYEDTVGNTPLSITAVAQSQVLVKTDAVTIKVPADKAQLIETRTIDGRSYILIPADGTVTVSGIPVRTDTGNS